MFKVFVSTCVCFHTTGIYSGHGSRYVIKNNTTWTVDSQVKINDGRKAIPNGNRRTRVMINQFYTYTRVHIWKFVNYYFIYEKNINVSWNLSVGQFLAIYLSLAWMYSEILYTYSRMLFIQLSPISILYNNPTKETHSSIAIHSHFNNLFVSSFCISLSFAKTTVFW